MVKKAVRNVMHVVCRAFWEGVCAGFCKRLAVRDDGGFGESVFPRGGSLAEVHLGWVLGRQIHTVGAVWS